jgi:hypothetical protein
MIKLLSSIIVLSVVSFFLVGYIMLWITRPAGLLPKVALLSMGGILFGAIGIVVICWFKC